MDHKHHQGLLDLIIGKTFGLGAVFYLFNCFVARLPIERSRLPTDQTGDLWAPNGTVWTLLGPFWGCGNALGVVI